MVRTTQEVEATPGQHRASCTDPGELLQIKAIGDGASVLSVSTQPVASARTEASTENSAERASATCGLGGATSDRASPGGVLQIPRPALVLTAGGIDVTTMGSGFWFH